MGIVDLLTRTCLQTAVYWGTPTPDGYGTKTFADPVEIACRWTERIELINRVGDRLGEQVVSKAQVFVLQDVDEQGYLFLGDLDDLDSDEEADPTTVDEAFVIQRFDKIPTLKAITEFVRKAYL